jgi:MoaA/NifB/PqqE/SkfB family radical SAM enzyme
MHLYIGTDGNVLPCCQADHQLPMGNITEQSIDSIMTSVVFDQLRQDLLDGKRRKECSRCYEQEDAGLTSGRVSHNSRWKHIKKEELAANGTIIHWQPLYLDIRLNNICNLKCRMCSGYFSSAIAQEEVEVFGKKSATESALKLHQRKVNLNEIIKHVPYAEKIYFAGGEPLLTSEHYAVLDALIQCGNTDLEIIYNTNFTTLTFKDRSVLDLWKKFTNVTVGASLDAQGFVAEYVRHGTKWSIVESNLELLKSQCPHVNFVVTSTVGLLNVASLIDLQRDWTQTKKLNLSKFSMSVMLSPDHLSLTALPAHHKTRLEKHIIDHIDWCQSNGAIKLVQQWKDVLSYMWSKDSSHAIIEFQRLTKIMDKHRNQLLTDTLPEYRDLI